MRYLDFLNLGTTTYPLHQDGCQNFHKLAVQIFFGVIISH